ncbi:hypothetical protein L1887_35488 [Cichorium endivia]|nr:hypothetical protein L1887_35488 [Cichorium endivia]
MLARVPFGNQKISDYRNLPEFGERPIPVELEAIFDARDKPKRGGKRKTQASSSDPEKDCNPQKKQRKARFLTSIIEEEKESEDRTQPEIRNEEPIRNEKEDTTTFTNPPFGTQGQDPPVSSPKPFAPPSPKPSTPPSSDDEVILFGDEQVLKQ